MGAIQRDWILEIEEVNKITSLEMQHYVRKMGSQLEFNAVEVSKSGKRLRSLRSGEDRLSFPRSGETPLLRIPPVVRFEVSAGELQQDLKRNKTHVHWHTSDE